MATKAQPQYFAGDVKRFRSYDELLSVGITKDGVVWDLSALTAPAEYVNFELVAPDGTVTTFATVAEDAVNGVFYADVTIPTPTTSGDEYETRWKASKGGVIQTYKPTDGSGEIEIRI